MILEEMLGKVLEIEDGTTDGALLDRTVGDALGSVLGM